MSEIFESPYFGVALSVIAFWIGVKLNRKLKTPVCNPLIIAIVLVSAVLLIFRIPYESYDQGGEIINMFLAPATACLAVAVYTKLQILKEYALCPAHPRRLRGRFGGVHGKRISAVPALWAG